MKQALLVYAEQLGAVLVAVLLFKIILRFQ